jgi:hypothetical protein
MINIIQFELESANCPVDIGHNQDLLYSGIVDCQQEFKVNCTSDTNCFWIRVGEVDKDISIKWISMFDIGREKLVYQGQCHNQTVYQSQTIIKNTLWTLEYQYPIFTWLHKTLQHGWLIKPD